MGGRAGTDNDPLYVVRLEPETRRVVVGPRSALGRSEITLYDVNWLGPDVAPNEPLPVDVKVRSTTSAVPATLKVGPLNESPLPLGERACPGLDPGGQGVRGPGSVSVSFASPQYGVSPGQAAVFYRGDRVLGGGWIARPAQEPLA